MQIVNKMHEGGDINCATVLREGDVDMVINTITYGKRPERAKVSVCAGWRSNSASPVSPRSIRHGKWFSVLRERADEKLPQVKPCRIINRRMHMRKSEIGRVVCTEAVAPATYRLVMELPELAAAVRPGQFLHLRTASGRDLPLRRPFSPSRVWPERGEVEIIYRVVGTELLSRLRCGDSADVPALLGSNFTLVAIAAGRRRCRDRAAAVRGAGCRSDPDDGDHRRAQRGRTLWRHLFPQNLRGLLTATDDGSFGHHGFGVELRRRRWRRGISTGRRPAPTPMMRKVTELCAAAGIACEVSLERRMGCGTGGCPPAFATSVRAAAASMP